MPSSYDVDVAIVGSRCGGAALARLTAAAGLRTVVIDRAKFPSDTVSTHSISSHGTELLHRWGLLDDLRATGAPNRRSARFTIGAMSAEVPVAEDAHGFFAPRRTIIDARLINAAVKEGATVWEDTTFLGVERDKTAVTGLRCRRHGRETTVRAAIVVGADGRNSAVARAVGASAYDVLPSALSGVYAYYDETGLDEFVLAVGRRTCVLALPTNNGQACIVVGGHDEDFGALRVGGDAAAVAVAEATAPEVAEGMRRGRRGGRFVVFRSQPGRYHQPYGEGWALVGDAGHYLDPLTGQGMANAYLGAHLLGRALVDGLGGSTSLPAALACYHRQRDDLTRRVHHITHELAMFDWSDERALELFVDYRAAVEQARQHVAATAPVAVR